MPGNATSAIHVLSEETPVSFLTTTGAFMCDEQERRYDSEPAIFPSLLFTETEVASVDWNAVFAQW